MFDSDSKPCNDRPERWVSTDPKVTAEAVDICKTQCPMRLACLAATLDTERDLGHRLVGIKGGYTPAQREKSTFKKVA